MPRAKPTRRSKFEIWAEVLEACVYTTRTQSWLLRRVGLKTKMIKKALDFLITAGLIKQLPTSEDRREFRTTAKGEEALMQYYQLVTEYFVDPGANLVSHLILPREINGSFRSRYF